MMRSAMISLTMAGWPLSCRDLHAFSKASLINAISEGPKSPLMKNELVASVIADTPQLVEAPQPLQRRRHDRCQRAQLDVFYQGMDSWTKSLSDSTHTNRYICPALHKLSIALSASRQQTPLFGDFDVGAFDVLVGALLGHLVGFLGFAPVFLGRVHELERGHRG